MDLISPNDLAQFYRFNRMKMKTRSKEASKSSKKADSVIKKPKTIPQNKPITKTKSKNKKIQSQPNEAQTQIQKQQQKQKYSVVDLGTKYEVTVHKIYQIEKDSDLGKNIKNFVNFLSKKQTKRYGKIFKTSSYSYYPTFQFQLAKEKPEHQKCSICQFQYESLSMQDMQKQLLVHNQTDLVILMCGHIMHYECLKSLIGQNEWMKCPVCSRIYGVMIGDQPKGEMKETIQKSIHCEGYADCGTIVINYNMYAGLKGNVHFPGTHRVAYLPDNDQGRQVLALLKQAFKRKLIFTVGRSVTTGRDNQIVWNGIHHKTNLSGGSAYFGYPDPTYFNRLKNQLAAKGVV